MAQIEMEVLIQTQSRLEHKVSRATVVAANIRTPGWINQENPKALGLRIDNDLEPILRFRNKVKVGRIVMTLNEVMPIYRARLDQLTKEISAHHPEQPAKIESFTSQEAAMLGVLIQQKNSTHIKFNGSSFKFEVDEDVLDACQRLGHLTANPEIYTTADRDQYIKQKRSQLLNALRNILDDENKDQFIDSQTNEDVEKVLRWLHMKNEDNFMGLLPDFLEAPIETVIQTKSAYVQGIQKEWSPSAELLHNAKVKRLEDRIKTEQERKPIPLPTIESQKEPQAPTDKRTISLTQLERDLLNNLTFHWSRTRPHARELPLLTPSFSLEMTSDLTSGYATLLNRRNYLITRASALGKLRAIILSGDDQVNEEVKPFLVKIDELIHMPSSLAWRRERWAIESSYVAIKNTTTIQTEEAAAKEEPETEKTYPDIVVRDTVEVSKKEHTPRILAIERRDPKIHETIDNFASQVVEKLIGETFSGAQVNRAFQILKVTLVERMLSNHIITPELNRDTIPQYTKEDVVVMLYVNSRKQKGGLNKRHLADLKQLVGEQIKKRTNSN